MVMSVTSAPAGGPPGRRSDAHFAAGRHHRRERNEVGGFAEGGKRNARRRGGLHVAKDWRSHGDSNPGRLREREVS